MAEASANSPLYSATFKNAGEIFLYLRDHPEVVEILKTRTLWPNTEANPLLELSRISLKADPPIIPEKTVVAMMKVVLSFKPNPEAIYLTNAYVNGLARTKSSIELQISTAADPQINQYNTRPTALQLSAYHSSNMCPPPVVDLLLEYGSNAAATSSCYNGRLYNYNASGYASQGGNPVVQQYIQAYTLSNKPVDQSGSNMITSLTKKIKEKPKLEEFLSDRKEITVKLEESYEKYSGLRDEFDADITKKKEELANLEEQRAELFASTAEKLSGSFADPAYCSEAKHDQVRESLEELDQLVQALRGIAGPSEKKKLDTPT